MSSSDDEALDRTANVLGALSLMITDEMAEAVTGVAGHSVTAATALSAMHHFLDRPTIDLLRQVLGLTSSGTVRLVDRLEQDGYVTRGPGPDGRSTAVALTAAGHKAAAKVSAARTAVLAGALGALSAEERAVLEGLAGRVLAGLVRGPGATRWMCRLCDTTACGHEDGRCPVTRAVAERRSQ
jgi:DNA-binding MarR family transcriptional regulator